MLVNPIKQNFYIIFFKQNEISIFALDLIQQYFTISRSHETFILAMNSKPFKIEGHSQGVRRRRRGLARCLFKLNAPISLIFLKQLFICA